MWEEDNDDLYRPKKTNSRKSLAPLFVYLILQKHSSFDHPMRQQEILDKLEQYPYEIRLERKALSRILHNLEDSGLWIHSYPGMGVWMDRGNRAA